MDFDVIIVGAGICGVLLSRALIKEGASVVVIDNGQRSSSTMTAGGIMNPVTGKRLVTSWLTDSLFPFAKATYKQMEAELNTQLLSELEILDFHAVAEHRDLFNTRAIQGNSFLSCITDEMQWREYFRFNYGIGKITSCMLLNTNVIIQKWMEKLKTAQVFLEQEFDFGQLSLSADGVVYNGISAHKVIFCEGAAAAINPWFERLPWAKDKGEALLVEIKDLPRNHIYKQGVSIVPWRDDLFWVGALHDWKYTDMKPTYAFRLNVEEQMNNWLKCSFTILDHIVAARPANIDRKPFIGFHPGNSSIGIFNGMGGKGFSTAPFFANQFCRHILNNEPLMAEVNVNRYARILSR